MPFVCHSLGLSFGFLKMCPNVLMGLKAILMLALPKISPIRSDTPWTYGMVVKVFSQATALLPLYCLSTADFLGGSQVLFMNSDGYPFVSKSRKTLCFSFSFPLILDGIYLYVSFWYISTSMFPFGHILQFVSRNGMFWPSSETDGISVVN